MQTEKIKYIKVETHGKVFFINISTIYEKNHETVLKIRKITFELEICLFINYNNLLRIKYF